MGTDAYDGLKMEYKTNSKRKSTKVIVVNISKTGSAEGEKAEAKII